MKQNYQIRSGKVTRTVEYADSEGELVFGFDFGEVVLLELSPTTISDRYKKAALAAQKFLQTQTGESVIFIPRSVAVELGLNE